MDFDWIGELGRLEVMIGGMLEVENFSDLLAKVLVFNEEMFFTKF